MSFGLKWEQTVRKNIRRIVRKQLDQALEELTGKGQRERDEVVHEVRLCFKKVRSVLRLVRPEIGEKCYRAENVCFRDAARPLTEVRDARILMETIDTLRKHFKEHVAGRAFQNVRAAMRDHLRSVRKRVLDDENAFSVVAETVRRARDRVSDWAKFPDRWPVLGEGLEDTYRRASDDFDVAENDPIVEKLHEWRKSAKYLRYQLEIVTPIWSERLEELANEADKMSDLLGDDHDLSVLRQMLTDDPERFGDEDDQEMLLALIDRRRADLTKDALDLGRRYFQDRPNEFARRLKKYWKNWRSPAEAPATP
jgi:CHAD domain-containing protein